MGFPSTFRALEGASASRAAARRGRASVLLLFVPGLALLSFALWQRARGPIEPPESVAPAAPQRTVLDGKVPGWSGEIVLPSGAGLAARLERMHPVPERQAFDVEALKRAFPEATAAPGEPWRLVLVAPPAEGEGVDPVVIEALDQVRVRGLRSLVAGTGPQPGGAPTDPVAVLMAAPTEPLHVGETVVLKFWGAAPGDEALLELPGGETTLTLTPRVRRGSAATESLAAVDARAEAEDRGEEQR